MYEIKNLTGFAKYIGKQVAKDASFTKKELQSYIKVKNIKNIIKQHAHQKKGSNKLCVTNEDVATICEDIFDWLVGVDLAKLAANDKIDCYWDDKEDCMVFQSKGENKNDLA